MSSEASRTEAVTNGDDEVVSSSSSSSCLPGEELLSNLMSALAAGARAVQGLPVEDDFEYHSSFPEFRNLVQQNETDLSHHQTHACAPTQSVQSRSLNKMLATPFSDKLTLSNGFRKQTAMLWHVGA